MIENGKSMKIMMPNHLYAALWQEAKDAGVTMADLIRLAVKSRYEDASWADPEARRVLEPKDAS